MNTPAFELLRWQDWAGNACYILLAASYLVTNIYWLRMLAIIALAFEALYFWFGAVTPLWVGIVWNVVFVAINILQLIILYRERWQVRFTDSERLLHQGLFAEFGPIEFSRLLKSGAWRQVYAGTLLTIEGRTVPDLFVLVQGLAKVEVAGETIALLQPGAFVGEMSLLTHEPASATVITVADCLVFAISQEKLSELLDKDDAVRSAVHRVIGRDLVTKLKTGWAAIE